MRWVVGITATLGCGSTVDRMPTNSTDGQTVMIIGGPSSEPFIDKRNESNQDVGRIDSPKLDSTPASVVIRERCQNPGKPDPPGGELAWISECQIKTVKPIYFQFNSDVIHIESEFTLQAVANILFGDPTLRVEIGAHSDGKGSRQYNLELTQRRADAVKMFLVGRGIDAERLIARGFGEGQPISHPPLVDGQRTTRRIEFVIIRP
jgi:outer membrane protein OmpA-like peptidoglycan-associated protein